MIQWVEIDILSSSNQRERGKEKLQEKPFRDHLQNNFMINDFVPENFVLSALNSNALKGVGSERLKLK